MTCVTSRQRKILEALATKNGEMFGLDLIKIGAASRMSLYVELNRLENLGWIESRFEDRPATNTAARRRLYRITSGGAIFYQRED